ncbi:unnamed protein product [Adineta ricciae]|uniref:Ufm1-specific protease 2 n=1 Tax=Adineta ricciae TaxID=249248 RepID=A0A815UCX6_ADIRI|nr:unnamed protein product [Adineta ricciae]CAF1520871.1 unnamed protein product [Adineta ricciae]
MLIISSNLQDESILIRISCQTNLFSTQDNDEELSAFRALLTDSGYHLNSPLNIYFTRDAVFTNDGKYSLDEVTLGEFIEENDKNDKKPKNDAYRRIYPWQMISGRLMRHTTGDESCYTPVLDKCNTKKKGQNIPLNLDLLAVAERSTTIGDLRRQLESQLARQLDILEESLNRRTQNNKTFRHYYVKSINQIVTVSDDDKDNVRNELQVKYPQLPMNQPFISMDFGDGQLASLMTSGRLFDVHKNLPAKVKGGEQTLVDGHYAYYHYMQDNFDDNMWGCAYRSLQTLCSWFILQGYTTKPVPTHAQIQQTLIDIEDKPKKFLNSRQWIGSMEVSFVLQNYLNVECKIIRVERGADMVEHVRELINHFKREGTPIMIGGGVLAHTIIGVDFNESTGDSMLLVLDPHYTGVDDIKTIQDKGWVGWKPWSFWSKDAFYNLCCPIRPKLSSS